MNFIVCGAPLIDKSKALTSAFDSAFKDSNYILLLEKRASQIFTDSDPHVLNKACEQFLGTKVDARQYIRELPRQVKNAPNVIRYIVIRYIITNLEHDDGNIIFADVFDPSIFQLCKQRFDDVRVIIAHDPIGVIMERYVAQKPNEYDPNSIYAIWTMWERLKDEAVGLPVTHVRSESNQLLID